MSLFVFLDVPLSCRSFWHFAVTAFLNLRPVVNISGISCSATLNSWGADFCDRCHRLGCYCQAIKAVNRIITGFLVGSAARDYSQAGFATRVIPYSIVLA
jgi:hypothetical protein